MRFVLVFIISASCFAQDMTYSKAEETRFHELNFAWFHANTYASKPYFRAVIDSINQFLHRYPNSVYKTGLLSYKLDLMAAISSDAMSISKLVDTLLRYDSLGTAKLWVANILISRNLIAGRGANLLHEALPVLNSVLQRYRALTLLAQYEMARGNFTSAKEQLQSAIRIDSTSYEAWYAYLALVRAKEDPSAANAIQREIDRLEQKDLLHFSEESTKSPNLFKSVSPYVLKDINGAPVLLGSLRNKVIVMNVFNFSCGACVAELPILRSLGNEFPSVLFLYVTSDDPGEAKNHYLSMPRFRFLRAEKLLFDDVRIRIAMGINAVPRTLMVDKHGVVRFDYLGYSNRSKDLFEENIRRLLHER